MREHYTDEEFKAASKAAFEIRDDEFDVRDWDETDSVERELYECQARAVLDAVAPAIAARALLNAAEFFETDMSQAWGGGYPWMTNGTKCARVVADVLRECANFETEDRADEIEGR